MNYLKGIGIFIFGLALGCIATSYVLESSVERMETATEIIQDFKTKAVNDGEQNQLLILREKIETLQVFLSEYKNGSDQVNPYKKEISSIQTSLENSSNYLQQSDSSTIKLHQAVQTELNNLKSEVEFQFGNF